MQLRLQGGNEDNEPLDWPCPGTVESPYWRPSKIGLISARKDVGIADPAFAEDNLTLGSLSYLKLPFVSAEMLFSSLPISTT